MGLQGHRAAREGLLQQGHEAIDLRDRIFMGYIRITAGGHYGMHNHCQRLSHAIKHEDLVGDQKIQCGSP